MSATLRRFWQYFTHYKLILLGVAVLVIATTYIQVVTPDLLGQAVDCYITPATTQAFHVGESHDRFARTADGWKLTSRRWVELFGRATS